MSDVYLAHDGALGRDVAVKILSEHYAEDLEIRRRFQREAQAAAHLSGHEHIVTIFDVGEWHGRPFIVMEHLGGGTLAERSGGRPVQPAQALRWLGDAAGAIDHAHAEGIVHRDVKPANLIFDSRGELHVVDFGIARVLDATAGLTATGAILGTAGYLSPEQARGQEATSASDVYALGVVAYELLTGSRPFVADSVAAEAAAHAYEPVPRASSRYPELPPAADEPLERALAKDPLRRQESAGALVDDLRAAFAEGDEATRVLAPAATPRAPARPGRLTAIALLVLLLAGAAFGIALLVGGGSDPEPRTVMRERTRTVVETETAPAPAPPPPPPPAPEPTPTPPPSPAAPALSATEAAALNDEAFALMQDGSYDKALPMLQQAVPALEGTYSSGNRYEAYANYNLGYTLLQLGRCADALPYLDRSEDLQGFRTEIADARAAAEDCLGEDGSSGSPRGSGNGKAKGKVKGKSNGKGGED